jgi:hypothetical protein
VAITPEQAYEALRARLEAALVPTPFKRVSRVWTSWADLAATGEQPVLFIAQTGGAREQSRGSPVRRTLRCDLVIYANRGNDPKLVPGTTLNALELAVEQALAPDPVTGVQDLGGEVSHAWIEGDVVQNEGTTQEQMVEVLPLNILLRADSWSPAKGYLFGTGSLYAMAASAQGGEPLPFPTPIRFANLKEVSVTVEHELNVAGSQRLTPVRMAKGALRVTARARWGVFDPLLVGQVFLGTNAGVGARLVREDETLTVPAGGGSVPVVPPAGGTWTRDLGVLRAGDGQPLAAGTAAAPGFYAASAGSYTFDAADGGQDVRVSYLYDRADGPRLTVTNQFKGLPPDFTAVLRGEYNGREMALVLENCAVRRLVVPATLEQFSIEDFEFEAYADLTELVATLSAAP